MNLLDFFLPLYGVKHIDPSTHEVETGDQEFKTNFSCTVSSKSAQDAGGFASERQWR